MVATTKKNNFDKVVRNLRYVTKLNVKTLGDETLFSFIIWADWKRNWPVAKYKWNVIVLTAVYKPALNY